MMTPTREKIATTTTTANTKFLYFCSPENNACARSPAALLSRCSDELTSTDPPRNDTLALACGLQDSCSVLPSTCSTRKNSSRANTHTHANYAKKHNTLETSCCALRGALSLTPLKQLSLSHAHTTRVSRRDTRLMILYLHIRPTLCYVGYVTFSHLSPPRSMLRIASKTRRHGFLLYSCYLPAFLLDDDELLSSSSSSNDVDERLDSGQMDSFSSGHTSSPLNNLL